jgi:hypothetical protein
LNDSQVEVQGHEKKPTGEAVDRVLVDVAPKRRARPVWPLPSSHTYVEMQANSIKTAERRGRIAGYVQKII